MVYLCSAGFQLFHYKRTRRWLPNQCGIYPLQVPIPSFHLSSLLVWSSILVCLLFILSAATHSFYSQESMKSHFVFTSFNVHEENIIVSCPCTRLPVFRVGCWSHSGVWSGEVTCGCCSAVYHSAAVHPEPEASGPAVPPLTAGSAHPSAIAPSEPSSVNQTHQHTQVWASVFTISVLQY